MISMWSKKIIHITVNVLTGDCGKARGNRHSEKSQQYPTNPCPLHIPTWLSFPASDPLLPVLIQAVQSAHQWSQVSVPDLPPTSSLCSQAQCNGWCCWSSPATPCKNSLLHAFSVTIKLESLSSNQQNRNQHRLCEGLTYQISVLDLKSMKLGSLQEQRQTSTQWRLDKISADTQPMKEVHKPKLCCPNTGNVKGQNNKNHLSYWNVLQHYLDNPRTQMFQEQP